MAINLDGFEHVPADGTPFITLDNQRRFYINSSARKLLDIKPYDRLIIMYRVEDKSLAIVKPTLNDAHMSLYHVDKRYYMSARRFASEYVYPPEQAPYEFLYSEGDGTSFIFRLSDA